MYIFAHSLLSPTVKEFLNRPTFLIVMNAYPVAHLYGSRGIIVGYCSTGNKCSLLCNDSRGHRYSRLPRWWVGPRGVILASVRQKQCMKHACNPTSHCRWYEVKSAREWCIHVMYSDHSQDRKWHQAHWLPPRAPPADFRGPFSPFQR